MYDGELELWLRLLALHLEEPHSTQRRSGEIREGWLLASRGFFTGCVPVALDEAMGTAKERRSSGRRLPRCLLRSSGRQRAWTAVP